MIFPFEKDETSKAAGNGAVSGGFSATCATDRGAIALRGLVR